MIAKTTIKAAATVAAPCDRMARRNADPTVASPPASAIAHPRIDDRRQDIGDQAPGGHDHTRDNDSAGCDVVVETGHRCKGQPPQSVPAEDVFDEKRATEDGG